MVAASAMVSNGNLVKANLRKPTVAMLDLTEEREHSRHVEYVSLGGDKRAKGKLIIGIGVKGGVKGLRSSVSFSKSSSGEVRAAQVRGLQHARSRAKA